MGSRDKGGRESKKPRKDARKAILGSGINIPPPEVEIIRKKRKPAE